MKATKLKIGIMETYDHLKLQQLGVLTVVHLADRTLSRRSDADALIDELCELIVKERPRYLLINFGFVAFCSSELINALIDVRSLVAAKGGQLKVCGVRDEIRCVFQALGLDGPIFDIHDSALSAIKAFSRHCRDQRSGQRRGLRRFFPTACYA